MTRVLAADIGFGTTDILIHDSGQAMENCPKLVIPSRTQQVAAQIRQATGSGRPVVMRGVTMGGGPSGKALREHLAAGLAFLADPDSARTFHDDLAKVAAWGVDIIEDPAARMPPGSVEIYSGDIDLPSLTAALAAVGIDPHFDGAAIAVQDHGFNPLGSNRKHRFELWRGLLDSDPSLAALAWHGGKVPEDYTRMRAAASLLEPLAPKVAAMDTGPAALLGAHLAQIAGVAEKPSGTNSLVVNIGNGHTLAAILADDGIAALLEHHTGLLDGQKLVGILGEFTAGRLSDEEVFNDGGHGCVPPSEAFELAALQPAVVTGPKRRMLEGAPLDVDFAAPFGDMMLTGCFGLLAAWQRLFA